MTTSSRLLQALISALESRKGLKAVLESLYLWITNLSLSYEFGSHNTKKKVGCHGFNLNLEDVCSISGTLFKELSKRLAVPLDNSSTNQAHGHDGLQFEPGAVIEEIIMLLRCCIASVNFLENDQSLLVERCQFLWRILCMLYSCQSNDGYEGCTTLSHIDPDLRLRLVCRMLEVFVDELITHKSLSKYIKISASLSSAGDNMSLSTDFGYVLKAISAHFLQSVSGVQATEGFVKNLIWTLKENRATPEVSLTAAVSLLMNPALASVPALLHAHLISLVSDVAGTVSMCEHMGLNHRFIRCYLPAFERSVSLYRGQMSKLEIQSLFLENNDSLFKSRVGRHQGFESYICATMNERLIVMIKRLDFSSCRMSSERDSEMAAVLNGHVKENLHLLNESCRNVASLFLSFLIMKVLSDESDDALLNKNGNVSSEDICLSASILKLMSCSLLQTVLYMRTVRNSARHKTSRDFFSCKEYKLLVGIINSFGQYKIQLPIQALVHDNLEAHCSTMNGSKLMFVHFIGLLSVCLAHGLELLAQGCLFMLLVLMNVLSFEEGNLDFLCQLVSSAMEHESLNHHPDRESEITAPCTGVESSGGMQEGHMHKRSSVALASKFRKIQMCYIRKGPASGFGDEEEARDIGVEEDTCNGMIFFKCLNKNSSASSAVCLDEELIDFVKCKQGKDYSAWLKNRARYRKWKCEKLAIQNWERKRATRRSARLRSHKMRC